MYLKELRLFGFKSFADKTIINFERELTAIVGPNGSGKSNITDAIKWVLGEQSAKTLRGGNMQDVIFSGSEDRKALNVAEVSLIFDNTDKSLPIEYDEVQVTRRLFRNGDTEYRINDEKCRLKDISELMLDSGIGKDSFSIISQGKVEDILGAKPVDRRYIFEEAAGVLKYKQRKKETVSKLDKTQDNLDRVLDIVVELERQVKPLEKQSRNAKKYVEYKEELEKIEVSLLVEEIKRFKSTIDLNLADKNRLESNIESERAKLNTREQKITEYKIAMDDVDRNIESSQNKLVKFTSKIEKLRGEQNLKQQNILNSIQNRERYEEQLINLKFKRDELGNKVDSNVGENSRIIETLESDSNKLSASNLEKGKFDIKIDRIEDELTKLNQSVEKNKARLHVLEQAKESREGLNFSSRNVINASKNNILSGIVGIVADIIEYDDSIVVAIQSALGGSLENIVVNSTGDAKKAIKYLKENNKGRVTFLPVDNVKQRFVNKDLVSKAQKVSGFVGVASELVKCEKKYNPIISSLLSNTIVAEHLDAANKISIAVDKRLRVVTKSGEIVGVGGSITGGRTRSGSNGILTQKKELETLPKIIEELNQEFIKILENKRELSKEANLITQDIDKLKIKVAQNEATVKSKSDSYSFYKNEQETLNNEITQLENEINNMNNIGNGDDDVITKDLLQFEDNKEELLKIIKDLRSSRYEMSTAVTLIESEIKEITSKNSSVHKKINNYEIDNARLDTKLDQNLMKLSEDYETSYDYIKDAVKLEIEFDEAVRVVRELRHNISTLGSVNLDSISEYEEVSTRYNELSTQRTELTEAIDNMDKIISELDVEMKSKFIEMFEKINLQFDKTFKQIFGGGKAGLILTEPDNILESGIDIISQPPGKKHTKVTLLSGGEKALTAITLLISIMQVKKVPMSILDEIEAALDEANVVNVAKNLKSFTDVTQFIMVTHRKGTMEQADKLYGVAMQESGVSKVISVDMNEVDEYIDEPE